MERTHALEVERLAGAARDALTDEMVGRLSAAVADGVDLLDRINRSGVARALPALAQLAANGDLDRLVALARTYGAVQDAMTDEIVGRVADTLGAALSIADRLQRAGTLDRLSALLARFDAGIATVERALEALDAGEAADTAVATPTGGLRGLWEIVRQPENQETLQLLLAFGRAVRRNRSPTQG